MKFSVKSITAHGRFRFWGSCRSPSLFCLQHLEKFIPHGKGKGQGTDREKKIVLLCGIQKEGCNAVFLTLWDADNTGEAESRIG